jgi:hypothetical protein
VTVKACASATVTQTTIPQLINGFPEECIVLTSSLEMDEDGSYKSESESKTLDFAFGGCNNPGHGFDFNAHDQGFTVYYYGHTADGERLWLISETITTNLVYWQPYELLMYEVSNGVFGQPELPASEWGTITITLVEQSGPYRLLGACRI